MQVPIIIPTRNLSWMTINAIDSIKDSTSNMLEFIIIDNGSEPDEQTKLRSYLKGADILYRYIAYDKPLGFVRSVNRGIRLVMGDIFPTSYFFICNNDIFVSNGALDRMLETLKGDKVGIVGARCNSPSEGNSIFPGKELNSAIKYFQVKESLNRFANWLLMAEQATPERKVHFTAFYCTGFKMDMVKKIGLLDEDYNMGLFDDNDYCYRAEKTGWEIRIRKDSYIHHITSSTFKNENMDYQKLLDENRQVFIRKHGFDPWHY